MSGLDTVAPLASPASATTAIWPLRAAVSHTVTSANSPLLVCATAVGTLLAGSCAVARFCEVLLPMAVARRPF